ncbi:MAG TPA: peptide-methionine (S)-S-oxide reductase MsrA [Xanthobacteraceae bacterium]|jgi:peptide-methionine (S)-S-oxide reductase|nr:peptide-methionine (S)-S-oxide reductase MsrA [Xanthobacteraceae bacterium]
MKRFLGLAKEGAVVIALALASSAAAQAPASPGAAAKATFAGGCFWCVQADFDKVPGVISTTSGYTGGTTVNPTYAEVGSGRTGHAEAVEVVYDPAKVSYGQLLDAFWHDIDPLVKDRQFCDVGNEYRTAIFVHDEEQRRLAEESKKRVEAQLKAPVYTEIVPAGPFYPAEEYHQNYYLKNPVRYKFYRWNCGRDQRLEQIWGRKPG